MASTASSPLRRTFVTLFKTVLYGGILALIALVVAVGVAMSSLPSYQELVRRDDLGQMIRMHPGVDPLGVARAVQVRITRGRWIQGGSTITQQLARNIFLSNSRTFGRKIREAILALALERRFSKNQILELYLNRVYFGGGAFQFIKSIVAGESALRLHRKRELPWCRPCFLY